MEFAKHLLDIALHLNDFLAELTLEYGPLVYGILFLIVFCETGLVVTPFLPGDSLLFAAGALGAGGVLNPGLAAGVMLAAAILGDTVNYAVGKTAGAYLVKNYPRLIKPQHLDRTHAFFERFGGKTIVLARMVPFVRTFAPFVAGMGAMNYTRFMFFNVVGAVLWVSLCVGSGYWFGNIAVVKKHFELVLIGIVAVSLLPVVVEVLRARRAAH